MIARLAAKALIYQLQHSKLPSTIEKDVTKETIKKNIIDISLKHNILSPYTAFVGIEKRDNGNNTDMILREVPIQISADNQYLKYLETRISKLHQNQARNSQMHYAQMAQLYENDKYPQAQRRHHEAQQRYEEAKQRYYQVQQHYNEFEQRCNRFEQHYYEAQQLLKRYQNAKEFSPQNYEEALESLTRWQSGKVFAERDSVGLLDSLERSKFEKASAEQYYQMTAVSLQNYEHKALFYKMQSQVAQKFLHDDDGDDKDLSSEIGYATLLQRYEHEKRSSKNSKLTAPNDDHKNQDIIHQVIIKQKFDGLWDVDEKIIEQLTSKSLSHFRQLEITRMFVSAIIVVAFETRFASLSSLWYGVVQKTRKRLLTMLENDKSKLDNLLENIRKQI